MAHALVRAVRIAGLILALTIAMLFVAIIRNPWRLRVFDFPSRSPILTGIGPGLALLLLGIGLPGIGKVRILKAIAGWCSFVGLLVVFTGLFFGMVVTIPSAGHSKEVGLGPGYRVFIYDVTFFGPDSGCRQLEFRWGRPGLLERHQVVGNCSTLEGTAGWTFTAASNILSVNDENAAPLCTYQIDFMKRTLIPIDDSTCSELIQP